jgi:hypothetical protein
MRQTPDVQLRQQGEKGTSAQQFFGFPSYFTCRHGLDYSVVRFAGAIHCIIKPGFLNLPLRK